MAYVRACMFFNRLNIYFDREPLIIKHYIIFQLIGQYFFNNNIFYVCTSLLTILIFVLMKINNLILISSATKISFNISDLQRT